MFYSEIIYFNSKADDIEPIAMFLLKIIRFCLHFANLVHHWDLPTWIDLFSVHLNSLNWTFGFEIIPTKHLSLWWLQCNWKYLNVKTLSSKCVVKRGQVHISIKMLYIYYKNTIYHTNWKIQRTDTALHLHAVDGWMRRGLFGAFPRVLLSHPISLWFPFGLP